MTEVHVQRPVLMGLVMKAYRAQDFLLTVARDPEMISESFLRLRVRIPGMLSSNTVAPAMYVRLWFDKDGRGHQRAYTITEPDPDTDECTLAVALHDGTAARWMQQARRGDQRECTLLGRGFVQTPLPHERYVAVADMASLAALGDVLHSLDERPAHVILEQQRDADADVEIPARSQDTVQVVRRRDGDAPSSAVLEAFDQLDLDGAALWTGIDSRTTRAVVQRARAAGVSRKAIDAIAYWVPKRMPTPVSGS